MYFLHRPDTFCAGSVIWSFQHVQVRQKSRRIYDGTFLRQFYLVLTCPSWLFPERDCMGQSGRSFRTDSAAWLSQLQCGCKLKYNLPLLVFQTQLASKRGTDTKRKDQYCISISIYYRVSAFVPHIVDSHGSKAWSSNQFQQRMEPF